MEEHPMLHLQPRNPREPRETSPHLQPFPTAPMPTGAVALTVPREEPPEPNQ